METESEYIELDAVLDTMVDGLILIDGKGIITRYNPACENIFQYPEEDVIGQNVKMLMPEPYRANHDDYIGNYKKSGEAKIIGIGREVEGKRRDGSVFPMYLSVGETRKLGATIYVGIIRDLTIERGRRAQFEKLQEQHFHLSRVSAMDQMGSAIAHELNQPLTAIMNYLEAGTAMIEREGEGAIDKNKLSGLMGKTAEQTHRAAQILARLRRFIESGDVEMEETDIALTIDTAIELVRPAFKSHQISTEIEIESGLPHLLVSDIQIQQVIVNLVKNACEAMVNSEEKNLWVSAHLNEGREIKISIKDTGTGMSDGELEKLFNPFTTSKEGGLGVGLSISKTIMANHNGKLWAERNHPNGTCFYMTLPCPIL